MEKKKDNSVFATNHYDSMFAEFANEIRDKLSFQEMTKESTYNTCMD